MHLYLVTDYRVLETEEFKIDILEATAHGTQQQ